MVSAVSIRAQVPGHRIPVVAGVAEGVADQVQHARLHDRLRSDRADRFGQALEPVADHDAHIGHAPVAGLGEHLQPERPALGAIADPGREEVAFTVDGDPDRDGDRAKW